MFFFHFLRFEHLEDSRFKYAKFELFLEFIQNNYLDVLNSVIIGVNPSQIV